MSASAICFADSFAESVVPDLLALVDGRVSVATAALLQEITSLEQRLAAEQVLSQRVAADAKDARRSAASELSRLTKQVAAEDRGRAKRSRRSSGSGGAERNDADDAESALLRKRLAAAEVESRRQTELQREMEIELRDKMTENDCLKQTIVELMLASSQQKQLPVTAAD